jgi:hypothetical protein
MTDQAQKLIDELPKMHKHDVECNGSFVTYYIRDDVIALVEKLTGWTKVEDGLPEIGKHKPSQLYNVRNKDGKLLDIAGFSQQSGKWIFTNLKVSEWKPIF